MRINAHWVSIAAVQKFVVESVEERLLAWREAEQAAQNAEYAAKAVGQAAADPTMRQLLMEAKRLREEADRQFAYIVRAVRMDEPVSSPESGAPRDLQH